MSRVFCLWALLLCACAPSILTSSQRREWQQAAQRSDSTATPVLARRLQDAPAWAQVAVRQPIERMPSNFSARQRLAMWVGAIGELTRRADARYAIDPQAETSVGGRSSVVFRQLFESVPVITAEVTVMAADDVDVVAGRLLLETPSGEWKITAEDARAVATAVLSSAGLDTEKLTIERAIVPEEKTGLGRRGFWCRSRGRRGGMVMVDGETGTVLKLVEETRS